MDDPDGSRNLGSSGKGNFVFATLSPAPEKLSIEEKVYLEFISYKYCFSFTIMLVALPISLFITNFLVLSFLGNLANKKKKQLHI